MKFIIIIFLVIVASLSCMQDASIANDYDSWSNNEYWMIIVNPNPTTGLLKIKVYGLYSTKSFIHQMKVYDINGVETADLTMLLNQNNNGSWSEFSTTLHFRATGTYMLILRAGGYIAREKFLVIK